MFNISRINYMDYPEYKLTTKANHLHDTLERYHAVITDLDMKNDNIPDVNDQALEHEFGPKRDALEIVIPVTIIYFIIFLTGIIGNISTCIVIKKHPSMHTATNYYLFSLAISDFILLLTGVPQEIYFIWSKYPYVFGELFCIGRGLIAETSANATVLTITAFTVERYVAICHPWFSCKTMSKLNRAIRIIILIWIIAILCAIPQAAQFGIRTFYGIEKCVVVREIVQHSFQLSTIIFFFMPMSIIMILYILIGIHLYRSHEQMDRNDSIIIRGNSIVKHINYDNNRNSGTNEANIYRRKSSNLTQLGNVRNQFGTRRVLKMLVAVVICFFLCWAPFHAQRLIAVYGPSLITTATSNNHSINYDDDDVLVADYINEAPYNLDEDKRDHHECIYTILTYISGVLYYLSTCINPVLYNLMSNKYRQAFKIVLCGKKSKSYLQYQQQQQQQLTHPKPTMNSSNLILNKRIHAKELPLRKSLIQPVTKECQ